MKAGQVTFVDEVHPRADFPHHTVYHSTPEDSISILQFHMVILLTIGHVIAQGSQRDGLAHGPVHGVVFGRKVGRIQTSRAIRAAFIFSVSEILLQINVTEQPLEHNYWRFTPDHWFRRLHLLNGLSVFLQSEL